MTALIITALSTAAQTLLYAGLVFGCGVIVLVVRACSFSDDFSSDSETDFAAWRDGLANARDSLGDDALGEVGEGQDFGLNHRKGQ